MKKMREERVARRRRQKIEGKIQEGRSVLVVDRGQGRAKNVQATKRQVRRRGERRAKEEGKSGAEAVITLSVKVVSLLVPYQRATIPL